MRQLDVITNSMDMSLSKFWETVKDREAWGVAVHCVAELEVNEQQPSLGPTLTSIHDYRKNIALTIQTFVSSDVCFLILCIGLS